MTRALALLLLCLVTAKAETACIPWQKGTVWTYSAHVEWNEKGQEKSADLTWETLVAATYQKGSLRAARVSGFLTDLAWYETGKKPSEAILLQVGSNHLFLISDKVDEVWNDITLGKYDHSYFELLNSAELLLEMPLTPDARWGDLANTPRGMYCWVCEGSGPFDLKAVQGAPQLPEPHEEFLISMRTNPDDMHYGLVPGLGFTRFSYHHHGTTSNAEVKLIKYAP